MATSMSMQGSRYLQLRGRTYHYRRNVPADVVGAAGAKVWKTSLKTGDLRKAEAVARKIGAEHDALIQAHRERPALEKALIQHHDAKRRNTEAFVNYARGRAPQANYDATHAAVSAAEAELLKLVGTITPVEKVKEAESLQREQDVDAVRLAAYRGDPCPAQERKALYETMRQIAIEQRPEERKKQCEDLSDAIQIRAIRLSRLQQFLEPLETTALHSSLRSDPKNPRVKAILPIWFAKKKQGASATKRHNVSIKRWVALHGNTPIKDITRQHVLEYVERIADLSDHRKLPAHKRGSLETHPDLPKVTAKTVDRHLTSIKALLSFGVAQGWVAHSVANGVSAPKDDRPKSSKRLPLTSEQRSTVLAQAIDDQGENSDLAWLIRLGAYTGARIEELLQLRPKHVGLHEGHAAIEITDFDGGTIKNEPSLRHIPLHPAISATFMAWAHQPYRDRVFMSFRRGADGRYGNDASGAFGRLLGRVGLNDKRLVFHSFRHALKRSMTDARLDPDARRVILGHAGDAAHDK
ncbi:MAG: DUF6538 domain-containing protein [Usitatibacteraceae bacterium]